MGNKYWLPDNHDNLTACDGFYIKNEVFFFGMKAPDEQQWDKSIKELTTKLKRFIPSMDVVNDWKNSMGISRYVLVSNDSLEIILGEDDDYAPIFLIIPENCGNTVKAKREFKSVLDALRNYLVRKYPNQIYRRKNTWNLELVTTTNDFMYRRTAV